MLLVGGFGALALVLACIGLYGAVSYAVVERTQEIGIRLALGARRPSVYRLVLAQGVRVTAAGLAIGLALALGAARAMRGFLYGVEADQSGHVRGRVGCARRGGVARLRRARPPRHACRSDRRAPPRVDRAGAFV